MTSVRRATLFSLSQRYTSFAIQLITAGVLARLLTPAETGVYSLAAAFVALAQMLRDFGIGEYVSQERNMTREKLRTVFGGSLLVAWFIAAVLFLVADPVADYYKMEGVRQVLHVLAFNFVLLPIGSTTFAMLTKELAFKEIFVVQTASALVGSAISILLAWRGMSFMSLAWSAVASTVVTVLLLAWFRPAQTFIMPSLSGLGVVARFGGTLTIGRMFDQLSRRVPDLLIAQSLGFAAVGIMSKAGSLLDSFHEFFVSGIGRVATPAFARSRHAQGDAKQAYLDAISMLVLVPFVFFPLLGLLAFPVIRVMFGTAWLEAAPLLQIGAIGGMLAGPYLLTPPVLTAHGKLKSILQIQIIGGSVFLAVVYFAASRSLQAVAFAGLATGVVKLAIMQMALTECIGLNFVRLLSACARSALIAALTVAAAAPSLSLNDGSFSGALACLLTAGISAGLVLFGALFGLNHPLARELTNAWMSRNKPA